MGIHMNHWKRVVSRLCDASLDVEHSKTYEALELF